MRPALLNPLFRDPSCLNGIGDKLSLSFKKLCGPYLIDILWNFPSNLIVRPFVQNVYALSHGETASLEIEVLEHIVPKTKRLPYRVICAAGAQEVELVFFHYHASYLTKMLPEGAHRFVSGKCERIGGKIQLVHPDYITDLIEKIPNYEPIYPLQKGISGKVMRHAVEGILKDLPVLPEWLDPHLKKEKNWPDWDQALIQVHHPKQLVDLSPQTPARQRLAYDELLANQLALFLVRSKMKREKGYIIQSAGLLEQQLRDSLSFQLTHAQIRVLSEIKKDMAQPSKMTRLLQGDVGSGKTIVALMALLNAVEAGFQGAFMAPTDILARQHFQTLKCYCEPLHVRVELLTGREKGATRRSILSDLKENKINILIGTHALFVEDVIYHRLGLVVIDEQHRFGVEQRLALTRKGEHADLLVMSATPIPRSLALTVYGDMDLSQLDEKPVGRAPIETRVLPLKRADEVIQKLKEKIVGSSLRTQVYWVCPLVEESEKSDLMAAQKRYEMLKEKFGARVGLVHGQMKDAEKDAVMKRFIDGELDVLVATTVIEVGVDVKNASIMVIEHAERFGLAALHQLRGRVGRGHQQSSCLLLYGAGLTQKAIERLDIMRQTEDGFIIAQKDLELRGAGELLGRQQSGLMDFRLVDLSVHASLLDMARDDAKTILSLDPNLETTRGEALKNLLYLFQKETVFKTLKSG